MGPLKIDVPKNSFSTISNAEQTHPGGYGPTAISHAYVPIPPSVIKVNLTISISGKVLETTFSLLRV